MTRSIASLVLLLLTASGSLAQSVFRIDSLPSQSFLLNTGWKWHAGDNPDWAKAEVDDAKWEIIDPTKDIHELPQVRQAQIGWFRLRLRVPVSRELGLAIIQIGASAVFLDGKLLQQYGTVSTNPADEQTFNPHGRPIPIVFTGNEQVLAVRYSFTRSNPYVNYAGFGNPCLAVRLAPQSVLWNRFLYLREVWDVQAVLHFGLLFILSILHLCFYWLYQARRVNGYFGLYLLFISLSCLPDPIFFHIHQATWQYIVAIGWYLGVVASSILLLYSVYELLNYPRGQFFKALITLCLLTVALTFLAYDWGWFVCSFLNYCLVSLETVRVSIRRLAVKESAARVVLIGQLISLCFFIIMGLVQGSTDVNGDLPLLLEIIFRISFSSAILPVPIFIAVRLAREFAQTSRFLERKLIEVEQLSAQTLVQEQEKQHLLTTQNETLERQVAERTNELSQSLTDLKATQTQLIQKEKMASLGEITAGIAHEIQNPLNFVNNFSEVSTELTSELKEELTKGDITEAQAIADDLTQNLQKITHHGNRASAIVKGMLEHSRTTTGEKEPINLNVLSDEYLRLAYQGLKAKDNAFTCQLVTNFDPTLGKVEVVPQEIGRVLLNLYNNAFYAVQQKQKTTPSDYQPTITVSTRRLETGVEIRVKDNGIGIPDVVKAKIFQPFFTTKPTGEGTGLGLSLSYDIITKGHGGALIVESHQDIETTFCITVPTT